MPKVDIADILIDVTTDQPNSLLCFEKFFSNRNESPHLSIGIRSDEYVSRPEGELIIDGKVDFIKRTENNSYSICINSGATGELAAIVDVDKNWENAYVISLNKYKEYDLYINRLIGGILFRNNIINHEGIVIHASAIEFESKSIIFSAPSGTGKSTHSCLWEKYMGAKVLNDDCPAIRIINGETYVYGTPWSGSESKYINKRAPLQAVVILEQNPLNSIRKLNNYEAVTRLMPRCFLPYYDTEIMDRAISTLGKIISCTPVYLLKCRPDKEAMELVYQCVK